MTMPHKWTSHISFLCSDLVTEFTKAECLTADLDEQPEWLRENKYLKCNHRRPTYSFITCTRSVFQLHTETVNIWTHLLGGFYFATLCLQLITSPSIAAIDKYIIGLFLLSATVCHLMSTTYHIFNCHSEHVSRVCSLLDYCGIIALITFSVVPWIWYGFAEQTVYRFAYIVGTLSFGAFAINLLLDNKYSAKPYRLLRISVFVTFALSGVIPAAHWYLLNHEHFSVDIALKTSFIKLLTMYILYSTGTLLYALRIPERYLTGKCDIWCHSHQLFHVFVSAATLVHFDSITTLAGIARR